MWRGDSNIGFAGWDEVWDHSRDFGSFATAGDLTVPIYTLGKDWDGSTGNFLHHFDQKHGNQWLGIMEIENQHVPGVR